MEKILYWLYFEPYTFIFEGETEWVVYNTLNAAYLKYKDKNIISILKELSNPDNGYMIAVKAEIAKSKSVIKLIRDIRNSFSGDIIPSKYILPENKPFIFMPHLRLYDTVEHMKSKEGQLLGDILNNLNEVTFYLPGKCLHSCQYCNAYYNQFIHCSNFDHNDSLTLEHYINIFDRLEKCNIRIINIVLNNLSDHLSIELLNIINGYSFDKYIYVDILNLNKNDNWLFTNEVNMNITFDFGVVPFKYVADMMSFYADYNIIWNCIIHNEKDFLLMNKLRDNNRIKAIPFYNNKNDAFFKQYVYLSLDDITINPIKKQQIFRRKVLNENFFGKLYITPSGNTFSNMNFSSIGNITRNPIEEIVNNELLHSMAWLKIRNGKVCGKCPNRYLCPSLSNYEFVIGKENLCFAIH